MKRTFIAIDIPGNKAIKDCLYMLSDKLTNERIKWIDADILHLTLKFLGATDERLISSIGSKLNQLANQQLKFSITVKNIGVFKNISDPTIIWLGIETNQQLSEFKNLIDKHIADFGFPIESRKFSPHLTIGRVKFLKNKKALQEIIMEFQEKVLQQLLISEIIFYESTLTNQGAKYIPLDRFRLKDS